jgi:hypothetical protein
MHNFFYFSKTLRPAMIIALCTAATASFSQAVNIVSPVTKANYKLPDPSVMQTAAEAEAAITTAEGAGKALNAEAKTIISANQSETGKAQAMKNDYMKALTNFSKNDVAPYNADMANYTASGTKFMELLKKHNAATLANNALAAKNRKAATVAALNKEKLQIDAWSAKLAKWKTKLDAAKTNLDVKNAALQSQDKKQQAAEQAAADKRKASKGQLNGLLDQLTMCANYAAKCRELLVSKFSYKGTPDPGYFGSPVYKSAIAELYNSMKN